jgi:small subunit ribosomal protein YMR-31
VPPLPPQTHSNASAEIDHTPKVHPASPSQSLPESFASYRQKAQQHGPLNHTNSYSSRGQIGGTPGASLGPVEPSKGLYFDRSELPARFQRLAWSQAEIEAIESGGASLFA